MEFKETSIKSVSKALALLDLLALEDIAFQGLALSVLAERIGVPLNTAHNLLKTLQQCGYVAIKSRGIYTAGPKCAQMGRVAHSADPATRQRLLAELHRFVDAEGEACVCYILVNGERQLVASVDSTHAVRVSQASIEDAPFFARVTGRMLAACADEDELQQILSRQGWPGALWDGIDNAAALEDALARIRAHGWCLMNDTQAGLVAIACPILGKNGRVWGVAGTYAPAYRCDAARREELLARLRELAAQMSWIGA